MERQSSGPADCRVNRNSRSVRACSAAGFNPPPFLLRAFGVKNQAGAAHKKHQAPGVRCLMRAMGFRPGGSRGVGGSEYAGFLRVGYLPAPSPSLQPLQAVATEKGNARCVPRVEKSELCRFRRETGSGPAWIPTSHAKTSGLADTGGRSGGVELAKYRRMMLLEFAATVPAFSRTEYCLRIVPGAA